MCGGMLRVVGDGCAGHVRWAMGGSVLVGLHPDQPTEAIVDTALNLGKPFAVVVRAAVPPCYRVTHLAARLACIC